MTIDLADDHPRGEDMPTHHLAQVNIARMLAPLDSEQMAGFVNRLDEINALADQAAGFIWRLQTTDGNATALRVFDDAMLIVNLSVWEDLESLHEYTYKTAHVELIRDRKQWFSQFEKPHLVLWWIAAGHIPTPTEAREKLEALTANGPSPAAFTFAKHFTIAEMLAQA